MTKTKKKKYSADFQRRRWDQTRLDHLFPSKYPGQCCSCGARFDKNDPVSYVSRKIQCERCWNILPRGVVWTGSRSELFRAQCSAECCFCRLPIQKEDMVGFICHELRCTGCYKLA